MDVAGSAGTPSPRPPPRATLRVMRTLSLTALTALTAFALLAPAPALAQEGPVITVGQPVVLGPLDAAVVQAGVELRRNAIDRCYSPALATAPGLFGHVRVRLGIGADGQVASASLVDQTLGDQAVATCIAGVLQVVPLASAPAGSEAVATVPLLLTPAPVIVPRSKLEERLRDCAPAAVGDASTRTVLARIDVDGGRATAVEVKRLALVDETALACVTQALQLGPHRMGTGSRWYQWDLPE